MSLFKKEKEIEPIQERIGSFFEQGISIKGEITGTTNVEIGGNLDGNIDVKADVNITKSAEIKCESIKAINLESAGKIDGNIIVENKMTLHPTGIVNKTSGNVAEICAEEVVIHGKVKGNVMAKSKLTLERTAQLIGDITVKEASLIINPGASFIGAIKMVKTVGN